MERSTIKTAGFARGACFEKLIPTGVGLSCLLLLVTHSIEAMAVSQAQQSVLAAIAANAPAGADTRRGEALYRKRGASDLSCESCHSVDPRHVGQHSSTGKQIKPLSPLDNVDRFSDAGKVEKWFRRNCNDVFKRECTAQEKADFTRWLAGRRQNP